MICGFHLRLETFIYAFFYPANVRYFLPWIPSRKSIWNNMLFFWICPDFCLTSRWFPSNPNIILLLPRKLTYPLKIDGWFRWVISFIKWSLSCGTFVHFAGGGGNKFPFGLFRWRTWCHQRKPVVPWSKVTILGMVVPPLIGILIMGLYKPLLLGWWPSPTIWK